MSNLSRTSLAQDNRGYPSGLKKRLPYYAAVAVLVIMALAYFDGGEEPIRPIAQQVALSEPMSATTVEAN